MRAEIRRLHEALGSSIVYVTHDQIEALTLATKIVVLKDGIVQQTGTPAEIYDSPENLFVAEFMGAPSMNLIPATIAADGTCTITRSDGAPLTLETSGAGLGPRPGKDTSIIFGIRPEDMTNATAGNPANSQIVRCEIKAIEPTGSDLFIVFELGGVDVMARMRANTKVSVGDVQDVAFDMTRASYFSTEHGERLG